MFKTIIKKFKEWYRRRFCNVAIDYPNDIDYGTQARYTIDKNGNIKIHSVSLIVPRAKCEDCGKPGLYYGEYANGTQSLQIDAIVKHHSADGKILSLCHKCHIKHHETEALKQNIYSAFGLKAEQIETDERIKASLEIYSRPQGKIGFWSEVYRERHIRNKYPRVYYLAYNAKKSRTRKKNISRLEKIRRRIYE